MRNALVTGATGFVGRIFTRALLEEYPDLHVWALVRGKEGAPPALRTELRTLAGNRRFHVVEGDLTVPMACAGPAASPGPHQAAEMLPDELDAVFHLAAATEFRESKREQTFQANLEGTKNLLTFLGGLRRVGRLFHVSTAYVAGLRPGQLVREELAEAPERFANPYEESKHAAEWEVARSRLDWNILRLAIVVGDSCTGEAESDKMMYGAFKVYWRLRSVLENKYTPEQLAAMPGRFGVLGRADVAKNLICADDVVRLMIEVVRAGPPAGTVFHIVNPRPSSTGEMHEAMCGALGLRCLRVASELPAEPAPEELLIRRGMGIYLSYVNVDEPRFDQARLRALVGDRAVDAVKPASTERLRFLFGTYLEQRLEPSVQVASLPVSERLAHVRSHGRGALAYYSLRPGTLALPLRDRGYVPVAVKGRTAAMVGDPVCPPAELPAAVDAFLSHCDRRRLSPVAVQVTRRVADLLAERGGRSNRMGDEAELYLRDFDFRIAGGAFQKLRLNWNSAVRHGVEVREATYQEVSHELVAQVSAEWLETKINKRELGLILRPLPERDEPDVRKFFAFQGDRLAGFVVFNPLFESGRLIGYFSDLERYRRRPRGIRDAIILEAARVFQAEGHEVLSLGLAPLWNADDEDHPAASPQVRELMVRIRDEVLPVYNFEGVSQHKTYYQPSWRPTYFCSHKDAATSDLLNVFSMIGVLPPEAIEAVGDATLDAVQGA